MSRAPFVGDARPLRNREANELEHALGPLPRRRSRRTRPRPERRSRRRAASLERVDSASVRVELDLGTRDVREGEARELEPGLGRSDHVLVARVCDDENEQPLEAELGRPRRARARRARDAAGRRRLPEPLLPFEHLAFQLDLGAALDPGAAKRVLELVLRRRSPDDAIAAVGAEDPEPRAAAGARSVLEELGQVRPRPAWAARRDRARTATASARRCRRRWRTTSRRRPRSARPRARTRAAPRGGRSCSAPRAAAARRARLRRPRARGRSVRNRSSSSPADASSTCTSRRARSRCARNSCPSPAPSAAPSIRPGTSATVSCRASGPSTVPRTGSRVVNG